MDAQIRAPEATAAPVVDPVAWERLDPRFVTMERRTGAVWSAVMALLWLAIFIAIATLAPFSSRDRVPLFAFWAVLTASHVAWYQYRPRLEYRHSSLRVDDEGIEIRRGVFFRSIISVPRSRVQHTDVSQGPFERRHGLSTLLIYTAGVSHAEVSLSGLAHARAIAIRDALLPRERVVRT
jgi:membrane protein YdbS with pleckstrin-like domain